VSEKASAYDSLYSRQHLEAAFAPYTPRALCSPTIARIGANGFLTEASLVSLKSAIALGLSKGTPRRILELGCGVGGLSKYLAEQLPCCDVIGVDSSRLAIIRAQTENQTSRSRYVEADFHATGLEKDSFGAVVSLDSLYLAKEPNIALKEVKRLLAPHGGVLWFTAYVPRQSLNGQMFHKTEWGSAIEVAGLEIERHKNVSQQWRAVMREKHRRRWQARATLRAVIGNSVEPDIAVSAAMLGKNRHPAFLDSMSRIEITARRNR
jgi:ubiquinone/menaquinone biosynthesis C-methylase UbiE